MIAHALLVVALLAGVAACSGNGAPAGTTAVATARPVGVAAVREAPAHARLRAVGLLAPADEQRLSFKLAGVIERIDVDAGDFVERGTLLAALDPTEIDAAVERAAQAARKARRDLDRARALYADDVATLEQVQDLETAIAVAQADLDAARFNAQHARIVAPSDGFVLRRTAEPHELIAAGAPVLVLGGIDAGWLVRVGVSDRDVVELAIDAAAEVSFDAFPGEVFAARITRIATASDPATGTYEVELAVEPNGRGFVQGLVAKLELEKHGGGARLWIPLAALLEADGDAATVFVVDAGAPEPTVDRRRVRIGAIADDAIEVRSGLAAGERVVVEGAAWLDDGERVAVAAPSMEVLR